MREAPAVVNPKTSITSGRKKEAKTKSFIAKLMRS